MLKEPKCKIDGNLFIVDRTFPVSKFTKCYLTSLGANHVGNVVFGMGVTFLRDIDIKLWEKLLDEGDTGKSNSVMAK